MLLDGGQKLTLTTPHFVAGIPVRHLALFAAIPGITAFTERFLAASVEGDLDGLMRVLAPGVELVVDSGGLVRAPLLPVVGADKVARFLVAAAGRPVPDQRAEIAELNSGPAIVVRSGATAVAAVVLDIAHGRVARIHLVGNPEKLRALG